LWDTQLTLLRATWITAPDSVTTVARRLRTMFLAPPVQPAVARTCAWSKGSNYCALTDTLSLEQLVTLALAQRYVHPTPTPVPPLRADFWFSVVSATSPETTYDTTQPASGRLSLIYHWRTSCVQSRTMCGDDMLLLKTLAARYGDTVAVTIVVDADPTTTVLRTPATPTAIARSYQWYIQRYLGLPANVAVRLRTVAGQHPAPDNRLIYGEAPYADVYSAHLALLIDRQRQSVLELRGRPGGLSRSDRRELEVMLAHMTSPGAAR
jgi:hypothetical protein